MNQFFTPTMIIENTQLGKVVLLLKGLERDSNMEDEKSIFDFKYSEPLAFTQENVASINFLSQKSIFRFPC